MGLAIAICFFLTSFCVVKFTNNDYSIAQYNKILAINTTALSAVVIALSENLNLASFAFPVLAILFYIASAINKANISKLLEGTGFIALIIIAYLSGFDNYYLAYLAILIAFFYTAFKQSNNISYIAAFVFPAGVLTVYLSNDNALYILVMITLLASIRYYIERKVSTTSSYLSNLFVLAFAIFLIQQPLDQLAISVHALEMSGAFVLASCFIQLISNNKQSIIDRMLYISDYVFPTYLKILMFNIYAIGVFYLFSIQEISYMVASLVILVPLIIGYARLWYKENEYNF
jgi:hypothetical protein